MMIPYEVVNGFFVIQGSKDLPMTWSPNKKFGFDDGNMSTPVYGNSYNTITDSFIDLIECHNITSLDNNLSNVVDIMLLENPMPGDEIQTTGIGWDQAYRLLEYIFANQSTVAEASAEGFINTLDNGTTLTESKAGFVYDVDIYNSNDHAGRVKYVVFNIFLEDNEYVKFTIYFDPDKYIEEVTGDKYKVYHYVDSDGNDTISAAEWKNNIIDTHLGIFKDGRYKHVTTFEIWRRDSVVGAIDDVVDTGTGTGDPSDVYTRVYFYIYSLNKPLDELNEIEMGIIREVILEYLQRVTDEGGLGLTLPECKFHYPSLFDDISFTIIPVNNIPKIDPNFELISPINFDRVKTLLINSGYRTNDNNFKNYEIIYVGNGNTDIVNKYPNPFVIISDSPTSITKPMTDTIQSYVPVYTTKFPEWDIMDEQTPSESLAYNLNRLIYIANDLISGGRSKQDPDVVKLIEQGKTPGADLNPFRFTIAEEDGVITGVNFKVIYRYSVKPLVS